MAWIKLLVSVIFLLKPKVHCVWKTDLSRPDYDELCVETTDSPKAAETTTPSSNLYVETYKIKECSVRLESLESILHDETDRQSNDTAAMSVHSSTGADTEPKADADTSKVAAPTVTTDNTLPENKDTVPPDLLQTAKDKVLDANASKPAQSPAQNVANSEETEMDEPPKSTTSNKAKTRKYGCRICAAKVESAQALKDHHQQSHGIMYCSNCNKAFNNQLSLTHHQYEHKTCQFECKTCGEDFPFESQYKTHLLTHSNRRKHACTYSDCDRQFKNIGDRNRHIREHTNEWLQCLDCPDYKTKEKRNFESHRLKHSKIDRYWCELCGQGFIYNTQKIRHISKKLCKNTKP